MTVYQSMQALFMLSRESPLICDKVQINPRGQAQLPPISCIPDWIYSCLLNASQPENQTSLDLVAVILWACHYLKGLVRLLGCMSLPKQLICLPTNRVLVSGPDPHSVYKGDPKWDTKLHHSASRCPGPGNLEIDILMQKRRNSIANALELRLFCIKPLNYCGTSKHYCHV